MDSSIKNSTSTSIGYSAPPDPSLSTEQAAPESALESKPEPAVPITSNEKPADALMDNFMADAVKLNLMAMAKDSFPTSQAASESQADNSKQLLEKVDTIVVGSAPEKSKYHVDEERGKAAFDAVRNGEPFDKTNKDAVKMLQRALVFLGYPNGESDKKGSTPSVIDGNYGRGTQEAIKTFQKEHELSSSGELDKDTIAAMRAAVESRVQQFSSDGVAQEGAVLSKTLSPHEFLEKSFRTFEAVAERYRLAPDKLYAVIATETSSGTDNVPRLEKRHLKSLTKLRDHLADLASKGDLNLDPKESKQQAKIDNIFNGTTRMALGGVLSDMVPLKRVSAEQKLNAMRRFAGFDDATLRKLSTSWGYAQILGWHVLNYGWQAAAGKTWDQLLNNLESPDPKKQIDTAVNYMVFGNNGRDLKALDPNISYRKLAIAHNGKEAKQTYVSEVEKHTEEYKNYKAKQ